MTFAENINRICAERGTNLTAVIKQIKNRQSSYTTAINKRGSIPNQEELLALAKILQCSVMDFFADEEDLCCEKAVPENEDEEDILKVYRALPRRAKHEFMAMVYDFGDREDMRGIKQTLSVERVIPIELLYRKRELEVRLRKR